MWMRTVGPGISPIIFRGLAQIAAWILVAALWIDFGTYKAVAQTFPVKPIRLLVGTPAGGPLDIVVRRAADKMSAPLGQAVVVENRPGASGIIAVDAVIKSPADGYTVGVLVSPALINGLVNGREWKPAEEFTPIGLNYQQGILMAVNPAVPLFNNVKNAIDLVRVIRANPGKIKYATAGPTGTGNLAGLMMNSAAGLQWENVPYKGGAQMIQDLVAGDYPIVAMGATVQDAASYPGRLLLVATTGPRPQAGVLPLSDQGFPNIHETTWGGIVGPGRLPESAAERLSGAYRTAMTDSDYLEKVAKILDQEYLPPAEFGQMIKESIARWQKLIKDNNIKP
jgi:tripartite-type tricarboxylate transporter receptor subunit TctC